MKLRPSRWSSQLVLLHARPGAAAPRRPLVLLNASARHQSTSPSSSTPSPEAVTDAAAHDLPPSPQDTRRPLPSPSPDRATKSAKLAALHARLALPSKIPLQTLARALVTPSADPNPSFNNQNLTFLGTTIINYHVLEYLVCKWPRLPMAILYEALRAYAGPEALSQVARRWGTEAAAAPGEEVDPGLLQWSPDRAGTNTRWGGYVRADREVFRRGMSSRVVLDDDFGDKVDTSKDAGPGSYDQLRDQAFASFVQAVVGATYTHTGREPAKTFVHAHILSRTLDLPSLFAFNLPTRELSLLCAREGFEPPLARLESETGRLSRTPVFIVGIYSGKEKLGEAAGSSLDMARRKACMNALKAWYLYSPGNSVRLPSEMMDENAKPWTPPHIDIGEMM